MARSPDALEPPAAPGRRPDAAPGPEPDSGARRGSAPERLRSVWRDLPHERRLAAIAAVALIFTLFLPWYQETVIARGTSAALSTVSASLTGWGAFSFVEAAVLLVAAAVLVLLFARAEGAAFHVPGGDGGVVTAAGAWTCLLIVWRMFDKEGTTAHGLYETASGVEWGIFIALAMGGLLTYAGTRIRLAHEPEPPLPGEDGRPSPARRSRPPRATAAAPAPASRRRRVRPSSLAEPTSSFSGREGDRTQIVPAPEAARDTPVAPESGRRRRRGARPEVPALDFAELEQITFDEPPEPPTIPHRGQDPEAAGPDRR